jgi:hypothetical protein
MHRKFNHPDELQRFCLRQTLINRPPGGDFWLPIRFANDLVQPVKALLIKKLSP